MFQHIMQPMDTFKATNFNICFLDAVSMSWLSGLYIKKKMFDLGFNWCLAQNIALKLVQM